MATLLGVTISENTVTNELQKSKIPVKSRTQYCNGCLLFLEDILITSCINLYFSTENTNIQSLNPEFKSYVTKNLKPQILPSFYFFMIL